MLSDNIEIAFVQLPGRGIRLLEKPYETMEELVKALQLSYIDLQPKKTFFFGHSMGARVAFELTLSLQKINQPPPVHFFASACPAPCTVRKEDNIHHLPDDEFIGKLDELQGSPAEVLQNRELMELVLPALRADFKIVENYRNQNTYSIKSCVSVFAGKEDKIEIDEMQPWLNKFTEATGVHWLPGNHFFVDNQRPALQATMNTIISNYL